MVGNFPKKIIRIKILLSVSFILQYVQFSTHKRAHSLVIVSIVIVLPVVHDDGLPELAGSDDPEKVEEDEDHADGGQGSGPDVESLD